MSILLVFTLLMFFFRLWLAGFSGIHPDEAYYWTWAQDLKLGYFDHPPMLAWLIALGTSFFRLFYGDSLWSDSIQQMAFRCVPYFLTSVAAPMLIGAFIRRLQRHDLTFTQIACLLTTPLFLLGPQIITPDAPLFFGWAWCLYLYGKIYSLRSPYAPPGSFTPLNWKLAITFGIALAFCAYSKFTAILIVCLAVITGLGLFNTIVAGGVAFLITLPYIYWSFSEAKELGAGIFFQVHNATKPNITPANWKQVGDLIGAQLIFWGIPTFLAALFLFLKHPIRNLRLAVWAYGPLIFFSIGALRRPAEANWPLMGALAAYALVILKLHRRPLIMFWIASINLVLMLISLFVLLNGSFIAPIVEPISPRFAEKLSRPSRLEEFRGWKRFREFLYEVTSENKDPILVDRYQLLSPVLFYDAIVPQEESLADRLRIWKEGGSRRSQFDLDPKYHFDGKENYWLLLEDISKAPKNCSIHQTLFREEAPTNSYFVLKCSPTNT